MTTEFDDMYKQTLKTIGDKFKGVDRIKLIKKMSEVKKDFYENNVESAMDTLNLINDIISGNKPIKVLSKKGSYSGGSEKHEIEKLKDAISSYERVFKSHNKQNIRNKLDDKSKRDFDIDVNHYETLFNRAKETSNPKELNEIRKDTKNVLTDFTRSALAVSRGKSNKWKAKYNDFGKEEPKELIEPTSDEEPKEDIPVIKPNDKIDTADADDFLKQHNIDLGDDPDDEFTLKDRYDDEENLYENKILKIFNEKEDLDFGIDPSEDLYDTLIQDDPDIKKINKSQSILPIRGTTIIISDPKNLKSTKERLLDSQGNFERLIKKTIKNLFNNNNKKFISQKMKEYIRMIKGRSQTRSIPNIEKPINKDSTSIEKFIGFIREIIYQVMLDKWNKSETTIPLKYVGLNLEIPKYVNTIIDIIFNYLQSSGLDLKEYIELMDKYDNIPLSDLRKKSI